MISAEKLVAEMLGIESKQDIGSMRIWFELCSLKETFCKNIQIRQLFMTY